MNSKSLALCKLLVLWISIPIISFGQNKTGTQAQFNKIKETYQDGEDFFQDEDYKEAIHYFVKIEQSGYVTPNLQFKIGVCYLNIPGEEAKALPYLEEASKHISLKYKVKSIEERQAPLHSLFYLGNAYRIDNQLDKALKAYNKFINSPGYGGKYNLGIVENELDACERAKTIQESPVDVTWTNIGAPINTPGSEIKAAISGDETVIAYITHLKFYDAIYLSRKVKGVWLEPENINPQILSDGDFYPTAFSYDGNELYLVKKLADNYDLYVSKYSDGKWGVARPLNKNINTSSDEIAACISADGKELYFSSNRRDSHGGFDIFKSVRGADNEWGKAENLGKIINTKEDETTPSMASDGKTLYFSSKGHYNMGGYDIFYSVLQKDKKWSDPQNIGYPINTTNDNVGFNAVGDGNIGYISRFVKGDANREDIYKVEVHSKFILKEKKTK